MVRVHMRHDVVWLLVACVMQCQFCLICEERLHGLSIPLVSSVYLEIM